MTELTIPPEADEQRAAELISDHVDVGDDVEVREAERTGSDDHAVTGEVTDVSPGYLELDGEPLDGKSVRYDEIETLTLLDTNHP
ncbi:hypothetical protein [Halopiger goleimassiliensis]|uniref:hypothetical protein n=1 Tax=Halopiger goleimassiliensis TaxID=1293048 RepID=UPI00067759D0|nr:hypothetical protein [Halopiger goleimassiliensis]